MGFRTDGGEMKILICIAVILFGMGLGLWVGYLEVKCEEEEQKENKKETMGHLQDSHKTER